MAVREDADVFRATSDNEITWHQMAVDRRARSELKKQRAAALWMTGLSAAGKSTIASLLEQRLHARGFHTFVLDGDNVRHGLNQDLGFSDADRSENIRRIAEVARLMLDAGLLVIVSFISPFRSDRELARRLVGEGAFVEIFVEAPIAECVRRDPKGLYARALSGELRNFTGIDSPYEPPEAPEVRLQTAGRSVVEAVDTLERWLQEKGYLNA